MAFGRALGRHMEATTPSGTFVSGPRGGPILSRRVKSSPPPGLIVRIRRGLGRTLRKHRPCCVGRHISYCAETPGSALGLAWLGLASPWPLLGPPWPPSTSPWPSFGVPLVSPWPPLTSHWPPLVPSLVTLGFPLAFLGLLLAPFALTLVPLSVLLASPWRPLGLCLASFGVPWRPLASSWLPLGLI